LSHLKIGYTYYFIDNFHKPGFPCGIESRLLKKYWISKLVFKTLKKYWILPKCILGIEKVWKFYMEKKYQVSEWNFTVGKALHFLCNV